MNVSLCKNIICQEKNFAEKLKLFFSDPKADILSIISPIVKHLNSDILHRGLPVEAVLEDLQKALTNNASAVLQAPPGAGKTSRRWLR